MNVWRIMVIREYFDFDSVEQGNRWHEITG